MNKINTNYRMEILKIHSFLPDRKVKLISTTYTVEKSWLRNIRLADTLINLNGTVVDIHSEIPEAVKIKLSNGDVRFWHYKDLELLPPQDQDNIEIEPVTFDPINLCLEKL